MFLKSKTAPFSIKLLDQNRRNAVRIYPNAHELSLRVYGREVLVENISSAGVAFSVKDKVHALPNNKLEIEATLIIGAPDSSPIPVTLKVISSLKGLYRCQMLIQQRGFNSLCQYLVRHQIDNIRRLQKNKTESSRQD